jgi:cyclohexanecarboxylate-CoA ligase
MAIAPTFPHTRSYRELERFGETATSMLLRASDEDPSRVQVVEDSASLTRADLRVQVARYQAILRTHGVSPGDVVAVQLPNWWETVAVALAVWGMGAVLNPVTPIYRGSELRTIFGASRPRVVVTPGSYRDVDYPEMSRRALDEAAVDADILVVRGESSPSGVGNVGDGSDAIVESIGGPDDVSVLMFTSGTTGVPKGVLHSQRTLMYEAWSIADRFSLTGGSIFMPSPLTHITGLLYGILLPLLTQGEVVLLDRWDPRNAWSAVAANGCTFCVGATPFLAGLVAESTRLEQRSTLEWFVCGGADVPPSLVRAARTAMGTGVVRAYGLTELPTVTCGRPSDSRELTEGTDGGLVGPSRARLANAVDGVGELEAHGPELFLGYLDPRDNETAFTGDGWFRTGDLARLEDGYVTIAGRVKDVIVRGGENISAKEIEDLLLEMPNVSEVAIVGVPDPVLGERACAIVVPEGAPPALSDLVAHLDAAHVARQKFPEWLLLNDALPRTASGKVLKYALRDSARLRVANGEGEAR